MTEEQPNAGVQAERARASRRSLVSVARRLFASQGYAGTSVEAIYAGAGLTRGALYHHFESKQALFRAVFLAVGDGVLTRLEGTEGTPDDAWERFCFNVQRFLDMAMEEEYRQVVLIDGPAVLGSDERRRHGRVHGMGMLSRSLSMLAEQGVIAPQPIAPLAHALHGAIMETALYIATSEDAETARREAGATIDRMLQGLRSGAV